jgi:hypothetical protein
MSFSSFKMDLFFLTPKARKVQLRIRAHLHWQSLTQHCWLKILKAILPRLGCNGQNNPALCLPWLLGMAQQKIKKI